MHSVLLQVAAEWNFVERIHFSWNIISLSFFSVAYLPSFFLLYFFFLSHHIPFCYQLMQWPTFLMCYYKCVYNPGITSRVSMHLSTTAWLITGKKSCQIELFLSTKVSHLYPFLFCFGIKRINKIWNIKLNVHTGSVCITRIKWEMWVICLNRFRNLKSFKIVPLATKCLFGLVWMHLISCDFNKIGSNF